MWDPTEDSTLLLPSLAGRGAQGKPVGRDSRDIFGAKTAPIH